MEFAEEVIKSDAINSMQQLEEIKVSMVKYRRELEKKLESVRRYIITIEKDIQDECGKTGHNMIWEIEEGPYGERYRYCNKCGYHR